MVETSVNGIRDHKPWDRDQQFFERSGIRLYHFGGIRDQNLSRFWNQGSAIFDEKTYLVTTLSRTVETRKLVRCIGSKIT